MPTLDQLDAIERIHKLPYDRQLRHFAKLEDPWKGLSIPNMVRVDLSDVTVMGGDIRRMPKLAGKPCFGNPIAWLVHGVVEHAHVGDRVFKTRCGRCSARMGCGKVAESRLNATPELREAAGNFREGGGASALRSIGGEQNARRALGALLKALTDRGPFESVNDDYANSWFEAERRSLRENATRRKQEERERNALLDLRANQIPEILAEHLPGERQDRLIRYRQFRDSGLAPKAIAVDPRNQNAQFTADVWLAKTRLTLRGKPPTAYAIATEMIANGQSYELRHASLRDRVNGALKRIELLETYRLAGRSEPVWPSFEPREVLKELLELRVLLDPLRTD